MLRSSGARRLFSSAAKADRVVVVDGVRTPFHPSGTHFNDYIAQDLGRFAIKGLLARTGVEPTDLDYVIYGNVIQEGASMSAEWCLCGGQVVPPNIRHVFKRVAQAPVMPNLAQSSRYCCLVFDPSAGCDPVRL
jgi:hypothetical protein